MTDSLSWKRRTRPVIAHFFDESNQVVGGAPIVGPSNGFVIGQYWDFEIQPNPDWERFLINLPAGVIPSEVDIHTLSLPEPASIAVTALGCLALLRRRNA